MNYTNEEFEMMMQSLKDREQAMRVLRILKQEEKAGDAAQNAEFGTNNERNAEFRMQNAEARTVNAGAIVKQSESNGAEYRRPQCGKEAVWKPSKVGNFQASLTSDENDDTELWVGQEQQSARNAERPQRDIANVLAMGKQLEPCIMEEKREPDYAFWEETSENVPHVSPSLSRVAEQPDFTSPRWGALPGRELPGEFPLTALPSLALAMVVNVCDSVQVSYGMTACMVLGAVSAAAAGRVSVRVSKDYGEPLQLFIAVGANPSERKSACMGMVFHSLNEYEVEENLKRAPAVKHCKESKELLEEGIARAKKSGDRMKMADLIDELNSMQEVKAFELMLTDATPEALSKAMSRNGGRMALVSSEGAFLNILAGGYSSGGAANVDVVLKGYSGEPVRVERIGRGSEKIAKASLSLCLAVQPDLLETFLSDPTLAGRGMASRFLCCLPQSRVGARTLAGIPAKQEVLDAFGHRLREILSKPEGTELTLSPEAYVACNAWFQEIEKSLGPGGELAEVGQGWGGKLSGNTLRLAGLMQLLTLEPDTVSVKTMRGAVQIARWFRDHALRLMGGDGELSPEGNEALQYLVRRGQSPVSVSLIRNTLRKRKSFQREEKLHAALIEVQTAGYVRKIEPPRAEGAGRPYMPSLELHPRLLNRNEAAAKQEKTDMQ